MEEVKGTRLNHKRQLEDVPELIHQIQALLPPKDAARTCILSKSWLHAWSTTPTLRFCQSSKSLTKQQEKAYLKLMRRTIRRYHKDNIPIETCDLHFAIRKPKSAARAEKFIKRVASKSSLKELCLTVVDDTFLVTLRDEIFSSEKLTTLSIKLNYPYHNNYPLHINSNPLIVCVNLRELELLDVHIMEEVLHNLLSTCKLLEKINLRLLEDRNKISVKNLLYLQELKITTDTESDDVSLETHNLPCLCSLFYQMNKIRVEPVFSITDAIRSLRELYLHGVNIDSYGFCDIINTKFPSLEFFSIQIMRCMVEILEIRSNSLQRIEIRSGSPRSITIEVYAPKLLSFQYISFKMPSLMFPTIAPEKIVLTRVVNGLIDRLFFLQLREEANLSSNFNIVIRSFEPTVLAVNIDDLRTDELFPATNIEPIPFETFQADGLKEYSLFSIRRPLYVEAHLYMKLKAADYFLKLIDMGVTENKSGNWPGLQSCEIRNGNNVFS